MSDFNLEAQVRQDVGKGASRRLRREEKVPAIIYGGKNAPQNLVLDHNKVLHASQHEAFYSSILQLSVDGQTESVVLKAIQRHAYKPKITHLDFLRVDKDAQITMSVPLHFVGEDKAAGVKAGGIVNHLITQIEISCLPKDLPEYIEVDVSGLQLDASIHLSELALPKAVKLTVDISDAAHDAGVVSIHMPKKVEEPEAEGEAAEGEAAEGESAGETSDAEASE